MLRMDIGTLLHRSATEIDHPKAASQKFQNPAKAFVSNACMARHKRYDPAGTEGIAETKG